MTVGKGENPYYIITADRWLPFYDRKINQDGEIEHIGFMVSILKILSQRMNFTYRIVPSTDGEWGIADENGTWNGMLGMLQREEVDIALGPFGIIYERAQVCDFSHPIVIDHWTILSKLQIRSNPWIVIRPFPKEIWFFILLSTIFVLMAFYTADRIYFGKSYVHRNGARIFLFIIRSLFEESSNWLPKITIYHMVLSFSWMLAMTVIVKIYSGRLASLLTIPVPPQTIDSVQDLLNSKIPYFVERGSVVDQLGQSTSEKNIFTELWANANLGSNCWANRKRIHEGKFAQICSTSTIESIRNEDFSQREKCNFHVAKEKLVTMNFGIAFKKNSTLKKPFDKWIIRLNDVGIIEDSLSRVVKNSTNCATKEASIQSHRIRGLRPLTFNQVSGLLYVFLIGILSSIVIFIGELAYFWISNETDRQITPMENGNHTKDNR